MLLERTEELRALSAALDEARDGLGTTVLVGGEAGSGKSSLAAHFVAGVACRVLRSGCDGATTAAPLGPLVDVAAALAIDVPTHAGEPVDRLHLFAAVRAALVTELDGLDDRGPALGGRGDVGADRYLARRGEDSPALLLLTFRDDEVGASHPVRVFLGELATVRRVRRVGMRPLSRAAVAELARGSDVDLDALCDRTGGNAFYVTEVLAGGDGSVPPTVRDAVLARVARLSAAAQEVLAAAAVIGFHAEIEVLVAVSGQPMDALDECLAAGVLRDGSTEVVFRHELAREAVAASLLPGRRRALHSAAYGALRASARVDDRRLAHHAAYAGDGPSVLVHAQRAATLAAALGAHREAAEHYRAALRWGHLLDDTGRADLLERLSYECYLTGQLPEASDARATELALRRADGDPLRIGSALRWLSRVSWYRLRNAEAERYAQEAVETLAQLPDGRELAMAYSNMAQLRMLADDTEGAQEWGDRAVALARTFGDLDTEVHALNNVGTALMIAGYERGATILQESLDTALAHDLQEHVARAYTNLGATHVKHRRYAVGEEVLQEGIAFCADRDLESWTSYMRGTLAILFLETGRWAEARSLADGVATDPVASVSRVNALVVLGRLGTRTGADPAAAAEAWSVAEPSGEGQRVLICASGMAEAAWTRDDPDDIRRRVDAVWDLAVERGGPWDVGELLWWLRCAGETRAAPRPVAEPFALMLAGDARAAAAAWDAIGSPFWAALARSASDDPADLLAAASPSRRWPLPRPNSRSCVICAVGASRCPVDPARPAVPTPPGSPNARWRSCTRSRRASPTPRSQAASSCRRRRSPTTCPRCCASCRSPRVRAPSPPPGSGA